MRLLIAFLLLIICSTSTAQTSPNKNWIDSEVRYTDSLGRTIVFHNGLPKGGGTVELHGKIYSYVIFWTRLVNESASPLKLLIKFPADPIALSHSQDSHFRMLLPPDTLTSDKIPLMDYGLTNLQSLANAGFGKPAILERTLMPNEECMFYIPILIHQAQGTARAAFVLKGSDLLYRIKFDPSSALIPCGQIVFKN